MLFLPLLVFLGVMSLLIALLWTFDRLVGIEFKEFPDSWRTDRRPCPLLGYREDMPPTIRSKLASSRCAFVWVFVPPTWSKGHAEATRCVRRLRVLFLWYLVAMLFFLLSGLIAAVCVA